MFNKIANHIANKMIGKCVENGHFKNILGDKKDPEDVYLIRYFVFRSKYLSIYLHRFLRSDSDRAFHDHPFDFLSYIVSGEYTEHKLKKHFVIREGTLCSVQTPEVRKQGTWGFRRAETIHRVALHEEQNLKTQKDAVLTFIVRGPYRREWGFWELSKRLNLKCYSWVKWNEYLGIPESDHAE